MLLYMLQMRVLLDCDGVLADFITPALALVAELGGPVLAHDELMVWQIDTLLTDPVAREEFERRLALPGFCTNLQPYLGAADCVQALRELNCEVVIVTAPFAISQTWAHERTSWLQQHLGIAKDHVVHASSKHYVRGDVFVDDHPRHVARWGLEHQGRLSLLMSRAYNQDVVAPRLHALGELPELVQARRWMP